MAGRGGVILQRPSDRLVKAIPGWRRARGCISPFAGGPVRTAPKPSSADGTSARVKICAGHGVALQRWPLFPGATGLIS